MNLPTINSPGTHRSIHPVRCCYSSVGVLLPASNHPKSSDFLAQLAPRAAGGTTDLSPGGGGEEGGQMRSPSPYPISSAHHHTPFTSNPSLFPPLRFLRCLVTLAHVAMLLPSLWRRGREREEKRGCSPPLPCPQGPLACLPACPSCCSVQLWLSTRPRPAGISPCQRAKRRVCETSSPLFVYSSLGEPPTPATANKHPQWC